MNALTIQNLTNTYANGVEALNSINFNDDNIHEECGVFGIFGHKDAAAHTALGLHALQHRGQESAGIVSYDGKHFNAQKYLDLLGNNF